MHPPVENTIEPPIIEDPPTVPSTTLLTVITTTIVDPSSSVPNHEVLSHTTLNTSTTSVTADEIEVVTENPISGHSKKPPVPLTTGDARTDIPDLNEEFVCRSRSPSPTTVTKTTHKRVFTKTRFEFVPKLGVEKTLRKKKWVSRNMVGIDPDDSPTNPTVTRRSSRTKNKVPSPMHQYSRVTASNPTLPFIPRPKLPFDGFSCREARVMLARFKRKEGLVDKVTTEDKVRVRGRMVSFSAQRINKFLGLPNTQNPYFLFLLSSATEDDLDEVVELLGKPNTTWEYHRNPMLHVFKAQNLTPNANVWVNFVKQSISPTTHDHSIAMERMLLLFCLIAGKSINFGEYKEDIIIKKNGDGWKIDMKTVSWLRENKEKGPAGAGMIGLMQDMMTQNSTLMDTVLKQQTEFMSKINSMKTKVLTKIKKAHLKTRREVATLRTEMEEEGNEHRFMKARLKDLKAQNRDLKEALLAANAVALASASTTPMGFFYARFDHMGAKVMICLFYNNKWANVDLLELNFGTYRNAAAFGSVVLAVSAQSWKDDIN
ncbi:hypothetical protein L6452_05777 [Arctium lappa]|uniref:Uncharacterized protein n=1 Tax=Arctium lappa TaxID=4217 RepID=A0ACB9EH17_ARCLA|nr:hypothetical protein L6452_05777 [Arctium lappa]